MKSDIIIKGEQVSIGYIKSKQHHILYEKLDFDLIEGELVCLIGANGAGKSTLLRSICRMQPYLDGKISIHSKSLEEYRDRDLSLLMGLVLTDKTASGGFTVREIVELGRYPYTGFFGQLTNEDAAIVQHSIESVGIAYKADSYLADLSDGERQKVMIAKALSQECPIIILDEPTAFLDIESRIEIMNLLHKLAHEQNKTILLSTHDIDLAFLLSDKLWMLSKEAGLITGVTEDIILSGKIDQFFNSKNIAFNKYSGTFYPIRSSENKVYVDAENEFLFWTINLLLRLGFDYTTNKEDAEFVISVRSLHSIFVTNTDENLEFTSFKDLAYYLR